MVEAEWWNPTRDNESNPEEITMSNLTKGIFAALGARALTSSLIGFVIVFAILYWVFGGT